METNIQKKIHHGGLGEHGEEKSKHKGHEGKLAGKLFFHIWSGQNKEWGDSQNGTKRESDQEKGGQDQAYYPFDSFK